MTFSANSMSILKGWGSYAAAVIVRLKALAPYALIELVLPGGSVMALLLWLYRRRQDARSESVQGAELVPVKIAKIGQIEPAGAAFSHARRPFARGASSSKAGSMPGVSLSGRCSSKSNRHTIGARRVLAINGFCDGENATRRSVKDPVPIDSCGRHAKRTQYRIIETFRAL